MKKHIYNERGDTLLEIVDAEPECGEDFCDRCGDCLSCYEGEECCPTSDSDDCTSTHLWVVYRGDES